MPAFERHSFSLRGNKLHTVIGDKESVGENPGAKQSDVSAVNTEAETPSGPFC